MLELDRRSFIASLGGVAAVSLMSHEARADALEEALESQLNASPGTPHGFPQMVPQPDVPGDYPTVAQVHENIATRGFRAGTGAILYPSRGSSTVDILPVMSSAPTLAEFFEKRFQRTRNHCFQSASNAMQRGVEEEVVLACLLHDVVQEIMRSDHGYWGAQLFSPYVPEKTAFAIKYHQALRFYPDAEAGYVYPEFYYNIFGVDYVPPPHIQAAWEYVSNHRWYDAPRDVTVSDLYAFDPDAVVSIDPFMDLIGRHFKQPEEGLGNNDSPVSHMWRTIANPDAPL